MTACIAELPEGPLDIVGDVHGHWHSLRNLLLRLGYDDQGRHAEGRRLVFVGDLVDRGPDSPAVVDWVLQRIAEGRAWAVMGNHELNLLRGDHKEGNDWFWDAGNPQDRKFEPFARLHPGLRAPLLERLATLPLALERADLRVVHAGWDAAAVGRLRGVRYDSADAFIGLFDAFEAGMQKQADALLPQRRSEMHRWGAAVHDSMVAVPMLPAKAAIDVLHQNSHPIRVLTSGLEAVSAAPHFASGQWRFTDRLAWWNSYEEAVPIVIGHYWRRPPGEPANAARHEGQPPDLMADAAPTDWLGARKKVFCVDYSVAAGGVLGAMRWPEGTLVI